MAERAIDVLPGKVPVKGSVASGLKNSPSRSSKTRFAGRVGSVEIGSELHATRPPARTANKKHLPMGKGVEKIQSFAEPQIAAHRGERN